MVFQKKYVETFEQLRNIPLANRYQFYIKRPLLAQKGGFTKQDEPLVAQNEIETAGILCRPFWDDEAEEKELDSEGRAFADYRKIHPEFDMQIRKSVLDKLLEAQKRLPANLQIVLKAGLRPIEVQQRVFDEELENTKQKHPNLSADEAYRLTLEYVTDPSVNIPPHSTGAAIDIDLWNSETKQYVDVGSPVNAVDDSSWSANENGLNNEQIANRRKLRETMLSAGFAPLAAEWWHYSYGDQRWAAYYDKPDALYGEAN